MRRQHRAAAWLAAASLLVAAHGPVAAMSDLAERYVKLVLAVGVHDADYVDAYYGPPEWRAAAAEQRRSIADLDADAAALLAALAERVPPPGADELEQLRHRYLTTQVESLRARLAMLRGERFTFDAESAALYDAVAPVHTEQEFRRRAAAARVAVAGQLGLCSTAIKRSATGSRSRRTGCRPCSRPRSTAAARARSSTSRCRPAESFTLEYVTDKSWSGYNWYQGNYRSLIQINTDLPIYIDRAIDLACHEGYPGHHVYNVLLEQHLVRERGWQEYTVYPLFSPQSLIAEGTANYGIEVAFPDDERRRFERDVLFPAAGLDASQVDEFYEIMALVEKLSYAGNEAARRYRNGEIDAAAAAKWHEDVCVDVAGTRRAACALHRSVRRVRHQLQPRQGSRAAAISSGVRARSPRRAGASSRELISSPRLPSGLED